MNRKFVKIVAIIIEAVLLIVLANNVVLAGEVSGATLVNKFNGNVDSSMNISDGENLIKKIANPILSVVRIVAIGISVIMLTFLGIKYMLAAPNEKANIKNQLVTFTIGAVVVIGTTSILEIIKNTVTKITE